MTFDEMLDQVRELLQSKGRIAYRALKRRFDLDDDYLEDLKSELIKAERVAVDEDGEVLVWIGAAPVLGFEFQGQDPRSRVQGQETQSPAPSTQHPDRSRSMFHQSHRRCTEATSEIACSAAATSLARLWQQQSKRAEAHKLLSEVYNWFTEGFDTKDLQEAKALLEELAHYGKR